MTVRRLRAKQRGPRCGYCTERAVWRGMGFTLFACAEHETQLRTDDADQARRDEHYEHGRQYAH